MFSDGLLLRSSGVEQMVILGMAVVALVLIVLAHNSMRSLFGVLALLAKLVALALLTFLLLRPEQRRELPSTQEPSLLILKDASPSMETRDITEDNSVLSRTEAHKSFFTSDEWKKFASGTTMQIQERNFAQGATETDLSAILQEAQSLSPTTVLLVSDGAWNAGEPPARYGQEYRLADIALYSLALGSAQRMPDLSVEVIEAPLMVETEEPFALKLELRSSYPDRVKTTLRVTDGNTIIEEQEVSLEPRSKQVIDIVHDFAQDGVYDLSAELVPVADEVILDNNTAKTKITSRAQEMKVLLIDTLPRWEYRFIRNAMMRDERVEVSCLLLHPGMEPGTGPSYIGKFPDSLAEFDVILLGDIGIAEGQLTQEEVDMITQAVRERATGLILLPGQKGWQQTLVENKEFKKLYPVEFDTELGGERLRHSAQLKLSLAGQSSLLMNLASDRSGNASLWESLPGFNWYQPTASLKAGATALAYHDNAQNQNGAMPLVVTSPAGRGKVLYMGIDASWRWRRGVEDLYHYRFWRQMSRWMSYQRNLTEGQQARLFLSQDSIKLGDEMRLSLQAMTTEAKPASLEKIKLIVTIPDNSKRLIPLVKHTEWGEFKGRLQPDLAGICELEVLVEGQSVAMRSFQVLPAQQESIGEPADYDTLKELAHLTQAASVPYENRNDLLALLEKAANPPVRYEFLPLAHQWSWYIAIITALIASWIFRRAGGGE